MPVIGSIQTRVVRGLSIRDLLWLALAAYRLASARARLTFSPGGLLVKRSSRRHRTNRFGATPAELTRAVQRASRRLPFAPTCLERALALQDLLALAGLEGTLVIGVRREGGTLDAHAWLERDGRALVGAAPAQRYTPLLSR